MQLHGGFKELIVFETWNTKTIGEFIGSCIGIFLIGIVYEFIKSAREVIVRIQLRRHLTSVEKYMLNLIFLQGLSYFLMLTVMTYNSWIIGAVVLGAGIGYFIFGYKRTSTIDLNEHCILFHNGNALVNYCLTGYGMGANGLNQEATRTCTSLTGNIYCYKFVYNTTNPATGFPVTVNYGGCNNTCVNGRIGRGPTPEGVYGLDNFQGIYYCCTSDNCNTNSIIVPINNYVPRVNSCYSGFGGSVSGLSANIAFPKACGSNNGNQYCYKFEYENNGIRTNYKGCIDSCQNGYVGKGPIAETTGVNLFDIQGRYYCCITDNCNGSSRISSNLIISGILMIISTYIAFF